MSTATTRTRQHDVGREDTIAAMLLDEDYMSPEEKAEALALFRPGKWKRGKKPHEVFAKQIARYRQNEEGLAKTLYDRPPRKGPVLTSTELAVGVVLAGAAYLAGRWWARRKKVTTPHTVVHGDVPTNRYVVGALVLASV